MMTPTSAKGLWSFLHESPSWASATANQKPLLPAFGYLRDSSILLIGCHGWSTRCFVEQKEMTFLWNEYNNSGELLFLEKPCKSLLELFLHNSPGCFRRFALRSLGSSNFRWIPGASLYSAFEPKIKPQDGKFHHLNSLLAYGAFPALSLVTQVRAQWWGIQPLKCKLRCSVR